MAKKRNDFLSRIQAQQAREMEHAATVGAAYLQAAVFDAAMLTLGYDEMMGKNPWGGEKLSRFTFALYEWFRFVWYGVGFEPDADARRAEVDKLLRKKLPAKYFVPWEERYQYWTQESLDQEAARFRKEHRKAAQLDPMEAYIRSMTAVPDARERVERQAEARMHEQEEKTC